MNADKHGWRIKEKFKPPCTWKYPLTREERISMAQKERNSLPLDGGG
jgi:hypothetical protein